jgi:hypothetical protein
MRVLAAALAVCAAACERPASEFSCTDSTECTPDGTCAPTGFCSFPDGTCPGGQRYGDGAGDLTGVCVGDEPGPDAMPTGCDLQKPFGAPVDVAGLQSADDDANLRLSADERTAYFFSARGGSEQLYVATRPGATADFGAPVLLAGVNGGTTTINPEITADDLTIVFASMRTGGAGGYDLYYAQRATPTGTFANVQPVADLDSAAQELQPVLTGTGIYFNRDDQIFRAVGSLDGGFAAPTAITELNTAQIQDPVESPDELTLYFGSSRAGGMGDVDVWVAHRAAIGDTWTQLAPLDGPVDTSDLETPADISPDGCRLYITTHDPGGDLAIAVATRPL